MSSVALLTLSLLAVAGARLYDRCGLARELTRLGVERDHIATWVCIAYHESRFDTAARNPHSGDHGLLQISELYWCGPGKACGAPCSAFRDDDIADDVRCALQIHQEHTRLQGDGFLAWVVYPHHCKHNAKKYLIDCDVHTKSSSAKSDDRARSVKTFVRNTTAPHRANRLDIDELEAPYLSIRKLLRGDDYVNEFERNYYSNKKPVNWLNFKIDNIDELKLPDLSYNNRHVEFSTRPTTTTTVDPELIGIRPPMPRKIESNQFRRRMMNLETVPVKTLEKSDEVPRKTNIDTFFSTNQQVLLDLSHNPFIKLKSIAKLSTEPPYTREVYTHSTVTEKSLKVTTPKPAEMTRSTTEKTTPERKQSDNYRTTPSTATPRRGKARYVPQLSDFGYYKTTQRPSRGQSYTNRTSIDPDRKATANLTESGTKIAVTTQKLNVKNNVNQSIETMQIETATSKNLSQTRYEATVAPPERESTTKFTLTTSNPRIRPTSITTSTFTTQKITSTESIASTEATPPKSTQSIFDLYLNPTRATIRPFKFATFENSPFKLRIFSGGTTIPPPSYISKRRSR